MSNTKKVSKKKKPTAKKRPTQTTKRSTQNVKSTSRNTNTNSKQVKRKKKRRKSNLSLYYFMVFVVATCSFIVLSVTILFRIEDITISGTSIYTKEEIIKASGIEAGDNLVRLKSHKIEEKMLTTLTNLDEVTVKKQFPSKVVITVKPAEPFASLSANGKYFVVSKSGKIIQENLSYSPTDLLLIKGFEPENLALNSQITSTDEKKQQLLFEISEIMENIDFKGVTEIDITDRMNVVLKYDNRITVKIGNSQEIEYKLKFAKTTIEEKTAKDFVGEIIIRDTGGASIVTK